MCYRVATSLDAAGPVGSNVLPGTGGFVATSARAGGALLQIGLAAICTGPNTAPGPDDPAGDKYPAPHPDGPTVVLIKGAIMRCSSSTSTPLPVISKLLSAALAPRLFDLNPSKIWPCAIK